MCMDCKLCFPELNLNSISMFYKPEQVTSLFWALTLSSVLRWRTDGQLLHRAVVNVTGMLKYITVPGSL